ncbi:hypothetical protein [Vibrio halioticoli]|uniref:hypothetical protein n=1 Tax=Vibrio halioticoli TaxID=71388 RepID=UPI0012EC4950|nr:hypothetical protein [Vibrio halioticoli]
MNFEKYISIANVNMVCAALAWNKGDESLSKEHMALAIGAHDKAYQYNVSESSRKKWVTSMLTRSEKISKDNGGANRTYNLVQCKYELD